MKRILTVSAAAFIGFAAPAYAEGDAAKGEAVFKKCMACHAVGEGAKNKVGPQLNGVVGSVIGKHAPDYKYSKALTELGEQGKVWDDANMTEWLRNPKAFGPGTKMAFAGLKKDDEIADVIAFLKTHPAM